MLDVGEVAVVVPPAQAVSPRAAVAARPSRVLRAMVFMAFSFVPRTLVRFTVPPIAAGCRWEFGAEEEVDWKIFERLRDIQ
ncbi:hypothetical protein GCM10023081_43050 [Arthrobacter ginkgonis]|uniref:Uncharacterized protein n=1 Tax=Arthrobacter ginkgonis TaxID=1630594 RepID=A0ABP7DB27_9MICC